MRIPARLGALLSVLAVVLGTALLTAQSPVQSCEARRGRPGAAPCPAIARRAGCRSAAPR